MKLFTMKNKGVISLILLSILFSGCATSPPVSDKVKAVDVEKESIGYLTLSVDNVKNTHYVPKPNSVHIWDDAELKGEKHWISVIDVNKGITKIILLLFS